MTYAPPGGLPALREAIAALYPGLRSEHIVVTNGASEALAATALALVRRGGRVSAGQDVYPSFRETAVRLGALLSVDGASVVAVNNPTIPHGRLMDLSPLIASIEAEGGRLVSDEVYLDLRTDAPGTPAASISKSAISIGDLSKPLGLGGLRSAGQLCRDEAVVEAIGRSVQLLTRRAFDPRDGCRVGGRSDYGPRLAARCSAAAENAPLCLRGPRRSWLGLSASGGWLDVPRPAAGPLRPSQLRGLEAAGFFLVPGSAFGARGGYRISLFAPASSLRTALRTASSAPPRRGSLVVLAKVHRASGRQDPARQRPGNGAAAELAGAFLRDTIDLARSPGTR